MYKLLIVLMLFGSTVLKSQEKYMSLCFGAGIPKGDLASESDILKHGYASTGFLGDYSGAYIPFKHIGIMASLQFISNFTDEEKMKTALSEITPAEVPSAGPFTYDIGNWEMASITAGPVITAKTGRVHADFYITPGLNIIIPPLMKVSSVVKDSYSYHNSLSVKYLKPGLNAGINLRFDLNEFTGIRLFAEYKYTSTHGDIVQKYETNTIQTWTHDFSTKIHMINMGFGLIYRL